MIPGPRYGAPISRDERGIESQSDDDRAADRHAEKWECEGTEGMDDWSLEDERG